MKVVFIPDSSPLVRPPKLFEHRISNTLWLTPKLDVCLTAIEILTDKSNDCNSIQSGKGFKVTLKLVDRATKKFIPFQFPTKPGQGSCVLQSNKLSHWMLKKDKQVCIKVVYQDCGSTFGRVLYEDVPSDVVINQLQKSSQLPGFKKIHFAISSGATAFVKSISYAIASSVNAVGGENPTASQLNDSSTEDENNDFISSSDSDNY
jgi:hypothetical protein